MANYKERAIAGTSYLRAKSVYISNPLDDEKQITFSEEEVVTVDGGDRIFKPVGGMVPLRESFNSDNMLTEFPMMDQNSEPTGATARYVDVYLILHSLYYHLAQARDSEEL